VLINVLLTLLAWIPGKTVGARPLRPPSSASARVSSGSLISPASASLPFFAGIIHAYWVILKTPRGAGRM
jgi:hypothetical protein